MIRPRAGWQLQRFADPTHGQNARMAEYNGLLVGIDLDGWDAVDGRLAR